MASTALGLLEASVPVLLLAARLILSLVRPWGGSQQAYPGLPSYPGLLPTDVQSPHWPPDTACA